MSQEQVEATSTGKLLEHKRPVSPAPSDVSMRSDRSKDEPPSFREEDPRLLEHKRPVSPAPSDVSVRSDRSKGEPPSFREEDPRTTGGCNGA